MEVLILNGKRYVKASKAAKDLGYASDYVGQLCRSGTVDAHLVGRTWYVNPDTLGAHRIEKKRNARTKAREYAKKSIAESKNLSLNKNKNSYRNIAIRYEGDQSDLVPQVKKVHIATEEFIEPKFEKEESGPVAQNEVLNKDKKIIMSGTIPVYDVDEETQLTDVTILSPRILRKQVPNAPSISNNEGMISASQSKPLVPTPTTFTEKLSLATVATNLQEESDSGPDTGSIEKVSTTAEDTGQTSRIRLNIELITLGVVLIGMVVTIAGVFMETEIVYKNKVIDTSVTPSLTTVNDLMALYKDLSSRR